MGSKTITVFPTVFRFLGAAVLACALSPAAVGQTITKCQDSEGNWHYGDFAAEACAESSTVTEIDQRGVKLRESEAPPTEEELEQRRAEQQAEEEAAERRAREREEEQRLLRTYDNAQSIISARDQRVAAIERDLESYQLFREDLVEEKQAIQNGGDAERMENLEQQIRQYDQAIETLEEEKAETIEEYNRDLERYRALTDEDGEQSTGES